MFSSFRRADFDALAALWRRYYPDRYQVDADLLKQHTVGCPVFDWGASLIYCPDGPPLGFAVVKKPAEGRLYPGEDYDEAYLAAVAYDEPQVAVDLLAEAKKVLRNRGVKRLRFGQDAWHFFAGCPKDFGTLHNLLVIEGFVEEEEATDLARDLPENFEPMAVPEGFLVRNLNNDDLPALEKLLARECPGRWHYYVMEKVRQEGAADCVVGLFEGHDLAGMVLVHKWTDKAQVQGLRTGENGGSVGPTLVAAAKRERGLGGALLEQALKQLSDHGVRRCFVEWTNQEQFYAEHGFEVSRRYRAMTLDLEASTAQPTSPEFGLH